MKHRPIAGAATILTVILLCCARQARAESISVSEYQQQLRDISARVEALESHPENAGALVATIPDQVFIATSSGEIKVNHKTLKDNLAAFAAADEKKRPALLQQVRQYIGAMSSAAEDSQKHRVDLSPAHRQLDEILARREFKKIQGPSAKDVLLARIYRWIAHWLSKLVFRGAANFDFMRLLIYLLVGAAATLLLLWTIRQLRRPREELPQREIIPFSPSARSWHAWLAEARTLAQQEDWRNAIHIAYWAGISYLEEHGAWKPNRARTPREYLRLIGKPATQYSVLAALTSKLEVVWYGYGNAAEADFQEALGQLEKLGCR
jgi:hypothetical protein